MTTTLETISPANPRMRLTSPEVPGTLGEESSPLTQEHIFTNLRLRRIVRENHNNTVAQLSLMYYRPCDLGLNGHGTGGMPAYERSFDKRGGAIRDANDNSNLLGTVGHMQANIYDNENCGDHLDIMSHYQLAPGATTSLRTCCWVRSPGDALFAIAGDDTLVHIISLAWNREIRVLRGHVAAIVDLQPHPTDNRLLASVGSDQTVRIWSFKRATYFHPDGTHLFTGTASGEVYRWSIPDLNGKYNGPLTFTIDDSSLVMPGKKYAGSAIDCIRFAKSNLVVKNTSGRIDYWDLDSLSLIRGFNVRHHGIIISRFDVSYDDEYLCVGNSRGKVYVYGLDSGRIVSHLAHKRSVRPVTCCLFSRDCRSVIYAGEGGFLWRYDYVDDETLAEWEKPDESASDDSSME
ncbi:WD40-repeat-containing domain protein [Kickxella alabastrina]|uniref:WD40-repeat-containing domain protein n=1 Tax=Kickxella alabastrina TaxID=61397 RepID=UPI00221FBE45|nr:WD40-repeat-containing domain protein [Kickxella alabastrina]KAI7826403.1 WD40-repeat-containing domain protein [Kickxella alabastrina]